MPLCTNGCLSTHVFILADNREIFRHASGRSAVQAQHLIRFRKDAQRAFQRVERFRAADEAGADPRSRATAAVEVVRAMVLTYPAIRCAHRTHWHGGSDRL